MKIIKMFRNFFRNIWKIIDRRIVTPLTKLVVVTSERFGNYSNKFEKWLSRSNTLLFLSLFIAIIVFVIVDQKVLLFMFVTMKRHTWWKVYRRPLILP